jgi:S1-C subfamily serine protease
VLAASVLSFVAVAGPDDTPAGAWLGVMLGSVFGGAERGDEGGEPSGVPIRLVVEDSPAAGAGLRAGDRILSVDGVEVASSPELLALLRGKNPGSWVPLGVERRGDEREFRIRLGARPTSTKKLKLRRGWVGVEAIDLTPALREHFGAPPDAGVMISAIAVGSPAEAAGFALGDVVYEILGYPVGSAKMLSRMLASGGIGNTLEASVARAGSILVLETVVVATPEEQSER